MRHLRPTPRQHFGRREVQPGLADVHAQDAAVQHVGAGDVRGQVGDAEGQRPRFPAELLPGQGPDVVRDEGRGQHAGPARPGRGRGQLHAQGAEHRLQAAGRAQAQEAVPVGQEVSAQLGPHVRDPKRVLLQAVRVQEHLRRARDVHALGGGPRRGIAWGQSRGRACPVHRLPIRRLLF